MHCRVFPSPCSIPMPNLARAPSRAISSVGIWPVLRNASDPAPWRAWMALNRSTIVPSAASQLAGRWWASPASRRSGVVARSGASSTVSASQPFGQAVPRFTGQAGVGVRLTGAPSFRWTVRRHPVEQ